MTRTPALGAASRSAPNAVARRAAIRPRRTDGRRLAIRLWLPLTPLFVLLAPFALAGAAVWVLINTRWWTARRPLPSDLRSATSPTGAEEGARARSPLPGELSAKPTERARPPRLAGLPTAGARIANPWLGALALGGVLLSLSGTQIDVETPAALIRLRIY